MTRLQELFLLAYYKAANTSQPNDWFQAALLAKQMYNESRNPEDDRVEQIISDSANLDHARQKKEQH